MRHLRPLVLAVLGSMTLGGVAARGQRPVTVTPFAMHTMDTVYEAGSPDGKLLLYHKGNAAGRLYVRDAATASERLLVDLGGEVSHPTWSLDGQHLAITYKAKTARTTDILIVTIATGEHQPLGASGTVLGWTARDQVLFSRVVPGLSSTMLLLSIHGGQPRTVAMGYADGTITPDGRSVIVAAGGRLVLHSLPSEAERTITDSAAEEAMPVVSPDGRLLAFASARNGTWALYVAPLDHLPIHDPVRIATLDGRPDARVASWTNTGALMVRPTYGGDHLYRVDMDGHTGRATGAEQRLSHEALDHDNPLVSPASQLVAYSWDRDVAQGLGVMDPHGGNARVLLSRAVDAPIPIAWRSPEEMLVYDAASDTRGFATVNARTSAVTPLRAAEIERHDFAWNMARQEVLYAVGPNSTKAVVLKALSLADGAERTIATIDYLRNFVVSPDGKRIAYGRWANGRESPGEIRLMTLDGQQDTLLYREPKPGDLSTLAAWSPDGHFLLYFDKDDLPRVMNVATHESWPLLDSDDVPDWSSYDDASWSPDGTFIVLPGDGTWKDPQTRVWEGVTYNAVTRLMKSLSGH